MDNIKSCPSLPALERPGGAYQTPAQLRKVLDTMFPKSYVKLYHCRPRLACSLFKTRKAHDELEEALSQQAGDWHLEASSEPASRAQVVNLSQQFQDSLAAHQAKPVGLCPIRRAIYDQCFDELIRQMTVGCVEQGLLLFQVRNELRLTMSYYRRAYESAVIYGLRKAMVSKLAASTTAEANSDKRPEVERYGGCRDDGRNDFNEGRRSSNKTSPLPPNEQLDQVESMRAYYESELAKRDEIIGQQRETSHHITLVLIDMDADPEKKSWVSSRFITREDCGVQKRRCRYADCGKEYSRGTSHMILKRHWARAHADPFSLSPKSRASIGEVSDDQLPPGIKPPPYRKKASPSKTSNSSTPLKKKTATNSSQSKLAQTGGQFDYRAVAKKLKETPGIHLSFNIHTPKTKGGQTLGIITAHTLNETSGVVKSVLLEYKPLPYPNDTTAIYDLLRSCIMRFGCREKIISVASNSSECVTSAVQELDKRYKLSKNYNFSTVHIRCFPQFVHLNVKDVFQSQNLLIESIRKVIDFINKQNFTTRTLQPGDPDAPEGVEGATILTNDKSAQTPVLRLPLDANKSSWNSTYTMIDTFLNQRAIIDATLSYFQNTQDFAHIMIDWDKLYTLVQLIKPFYEIISGFVEDEHAPVSAVAALIPRLIDGLTNSTWGYDDLAQQANNIRLQLEDYRDKFLNDLTIMASLLDPRIKDTFAPVETRGDMIQLLRDRIRDHPPQPPPPPKEFTLSENSIYQTLYETEHPDQVTNYFARERAFRGVELGSFWECYKYVYPSFYNLGRSLVCVQASSVPADRMFAAAEHTERERMGHTDTTVPKEINRSWASYLEK